MVEFEFTAPLFRWHGDGAWHFVQLPTDLADEIRAMTKGHTGGWGSVRVDASIGATNWQTSLFPHRGHHTFLLPVKAAVRAAESLSDGDAVTARLRLMA